MRILILGDGGEDTAAIESAIREREVVIRRANTVEPFEQFYLFAGWTLEETARNLVSPTGRRVDLTSSEFELLSLLQNSIRAVFGRVESVGVPNALEI